jgi:hypothetical protein
MKKLRYFTLFAAITVVFPHDNIVRADSTADQLRTQETHQQQLRSQTQQIGQQIGLIISEFDRNGMGNGQDVKTLRAIQSVLGQLGDEQMQKVIVLLQQARGARDGGLNDEKQAFLTQQGIIGEFRDLLAQFEKEQSIFELADRFDHLAKRQAANLRSAVDLAYAAAGKRTDQLDSITLAALQTQQSEQTSIATEVKEALDSANSMLTNASGADADQLNKALAKAQTAHLAASVSAAASDLLTGDLFRAAGGEKDARDTLRELADLLSPPKTPLETRKDQLAKVEAELQKEKEIAQQTKSPRPNTPPGIALRQADHQQAANVDDTDDSRKKLANVSPTAAGALKEAEAKMQEARTDAAQHRRDRTAQTICSLRRTRFSSRSPRPKATPPTSPLVRATNSRRRSNCSIR